MINQSQAQIYLADARRQRQTKGYHCWSVFNAENYQEKTSTILGTLFLFNYQILAPNHSTTMVTHADCIYYILPLYGGIHLEDEHYNEKLILSQKIEQIVPENPAKFEISNPFEENISFLTIAFKQQTNKLKNQLLSFNFKENNKLIPIFENKIACTYIGNFDGRKEAAYPLKNKQNSIFVYIIQGAFEFENRLLEAGDALSLKEIEAVEWEALSENALLLLIEIQLA